MSELRVSASGPLSGRITVPGDKSISHRSVMLSAIATGDTSVSGILFSGDVLATISALRLMGVEIVEDREAGVVTVRGKGPDELVSPRMALDLGNSGTSMRLLAGLLAGLEVQALLIGDESLNQRPMGRVIEPLRLMGADIAGGRGGKAPIMIKGGGLAGIRYPLPVASAQIKSAIVLAGLSASGETWVKEPGPARDHTERMLPAFGVEVLHDGAWIGVRGEADLVSPGEIMVPGDISSAAFFIVAALIVPGSELVVERVGINPTRTGILEVLGRMGAKIEIENQRTFGAEPVADIRVRSSRLTGVEIGGDSVLRAMDEIPVLCVAAAKAFGTTVIKDARELRYKESDRIKSMFEMLAGLGAKVSQTDDGLVIEGPSEFKGAVVESNMDHRVAMSAAVAGLASSGGIVIRGAETISTSFPKFDSALTEVAS